MKRVAALYDIHGNLPALEAVLGEIERLGVDEIVLGGDVVAGPMPRETMQRLSEVRIPMRCIKGNADREAIACMRGGSIDHIAEGFREVFRHVARQLGPEDERLIDSWPMTLRVSVEGYGDVLFCHATPRNDYEIFLRTTPEDVLLPVFEGVDARLVVCGHTHMQFDRVIGKTRVMNAGSVGMPFGGTGAYWLLLAPEPEHRHTTYDLAAAAETVRRSASPQAQQFAEKNLLQTPSEAQMVELFSKSALK